MNNKDLAAQYREKYGWEMPTLALARILYRDNNLRFTNLDAARGTLRSLEGKLGKKSEKYKIKTVAERPKNPYNLPKSYANDRKPFKLPLACNNILMISDPHFPYHNIEAISVAIKYGLENKVNTIFINGDLIDCHAVSKFEKDPKKRSIKEEFKATKEFLVQLRALFPDAEIYWLKGNHCIRWERFLLAKAPEIFDDPYFHLEQRLRLHEERIKIIDDKVLVKIGKLNVSHGHHVFKGFFTPVNPARGAYMKAKASIICGHLHRPSYHSEVDIDGKVIGCWTLGCLCELKPDYSPLVANSMHGFAHITTELNGDYKVRNYQIINGKIH